MAQKKPLVLYGAQVAQLQPGDTLQVASNVTNVRQENNGDTVALPFGTAVYSSAAGSVKRASPVAAATTSCIGIIADATTPVGSAGNVATSGVVTGTTAQWDAIVTGETGGLTANTPYYLDASTPGNLTATPPSTQGQFVAPVGVALSSTDLDVNIRGTIQL